MEHLFTVSFMCMHYFSWSYNHPMKFKEGKGLAVLNANKALRIVSATEQVLN